MVRDAVSLYCRLGFAKKKNAEMDSNDLHPSWYEHLQSIAAPVTVSRTRYCRTVKLKYFNNCNTLSIVQCYPYYVLQTPVAQLG